MIRLWLIALTVVLAGAGPAGAKSLALIIGNDTYANIPQLFEAARRAPQTLVELAAALGPREAALARELTKRFEEVRRGPLAELAEHYAAAGAPRGEVVLVIGPPAEDAGEIARADLDDALQQALADMSPAAAAASVAAVTGLARREVYRRALALKEAALPLKKQPDRP